MKKLIIIICFVILLFLFSIKSNADNTSPVGFWKTIDDSTGELKSIVKIWLEHGKLIGKIKKVFPKPEEDPNPKCDKCKGNRKDKPILGMVFLWGFTPTNNKWEGGKILDPENGKVYNCALRVVDGGKKLKVFGYIRIIFKIGRTQTWLRAQESDL